VIRRASLVLALALLFVIPSGATQLAQNIPITATGDLVTGSLSGNLANALISVTVSSPATGVLIVDVFETENGQPEKVFTSARMEAGPVPQKVSAKLEANLASTIFRVNVRSISGGTWTITSVDVSS
jgi:hypothetical protein